MDRASIQERFGIVGSSDVIKHVIDRARQVAATTITVLLEGESGVGKELIAQVIHEMSKRRHQDMVIVNCGAIPEGLIESELFGAEKGAYTGAVQQRSGYFEEADGGTIFLDEIGEMPKEAQVRLLRVLDTGQFSRVGSSEPLYADVRIVAATNKNLATEVQEGRFRKDLYYRLSTVRIDIPPLRERPEDIAPIFDTYLHRFVQEYESRPKSLTDDAIELLTSYRWPGNVRELRNIAEQCVVLLREETIDAKELEPLLNDIDRASGSGSTELMRVSDTGPHAESEAHERELLYRAILEMRMEMREMKDQLRALASNIGVVVPRRIAERTDFPQDYSDFVVMRNQDTSPSHSNSSTDKTSSASDSFQDDYDEEYDDAYDSLIEDVVYEVEGDQPPPSRSSDGDSSPSNVLMALATRNPDVPLPTVKEAERELIRRALHRFEGNRRKTAEALDISERTLYRKLKDMEDIE